MVEILATTFSGYNCLLYWNGIVATFLRQRWVLERRPALKHGFNDSKRYPDN